MNNIDQKHWKRKGFLVLADDVVGRLRRRALKPVRRSSPSAHPWIGCCHLLSAAECLQSVFTGW